jgi:hypothetical protein
MTEESTNQRPPCGNCGKPAIVEMEGLPVCIDCEFKFQQTRYMQFAQNAAMLNHSSRELGMMVGMPHLANEIEIPPAPVPPLHYNNQVVSVTGGVVGSINFGNVQEIKVKIEALTQSGEVGLADALASLTNIILNHDDMGEAAKDELLEKVAFLTDQAAAAPSDRKPGIIKTVVTALKEGASTLKTVADAWGALEPLLKGHFGIL